MKGLVLKILRGSYPAIPSTYGPELKDLLADMLIKDPAKRPSMRKILEKEFLSRRISKLLTNTIAKNEFSETFMKKHITPHQQKVILLMTDCLGVGRVEGGRHQHHRGELHPQAAEHLHLFFLQSAAQTARRQGPAQEED
jgi:serine/threonine protein kinase